MSGCWASEGGSAMNAGPPAGFCTGSRPWGGCCAAPTRSSSSIRKLLRDKPPAAVAKDSARASVALDPAHAQQYAVNPQSQAEISIRGCRHIEFGLRATQIKASQADLV